jgi:coenzyme F420-reducing hydrogenase delta subunit|tara:strand:- start:223 stop:492 length:270 start_codon:yes stop_codon:yes gene_type:complete
MLQPLTSEIRKTIVTNAVAQDRYIAFAFVNGECLMMTGEVTVDEKVEAMSTLSRHLGLSRQRIRNAEMAIIDGVEGATDSCPSVVLSGE